MSGPTALNVSHTTTYNKRASSTARLKEKESPMSTTIYLLRHGETLFNVQHKTQGWCDSPLTERGIEQARLTGLEYAKRGIAIDRAYSSTSERCCDTLEIMTEAAYGAPLPYERLKGLKEFNFGAFEAKDQFLERHGEGFSSFYVPFGGEDHEEALDRIQATLTDLAEKNDGKSILCVSHGGISISYYMRWQAHSQVSKLVFSNCLTYVYEYDNGIFTCKDVFVADLSSLEQKGMPQQVQVVDGNRPM